MSEMRSCINCARAFISCPVTNEYTDPEKFSCCEWLGANSTDTKTEEKMKSCFTCEKWGDEECPVVIGRGARPGKFHCCEWVQTSEEHRSSEFAYCKIELLGRVTIFGLIEHNPEEMPGTIKVTTQDEVAYYGYGAIYKISYDEVPF